MLTDTGLKKLNKEICCAVWKVPLNEESTTMTTLQTVYEWLQSGKYAVENDLTRAFLQLLNDPWYLQLLETVVTQPYEYIFVAIILAIYNLTILTRPPNRQFFPCQYFRPFGITLLNKVTSIYVHCKSQIHEAKSFIRLRGSKVEVSRNQGGTNLDVKSLK